MSNLAPVAVEVLDRIACRSVVHALKVTFLNCLSATKGSASQTNHIAMFLVKDADKHGMENQPSAGWKGGPAAWAEAFHRPAGQVGDHWDQNIHQG